jgi:hypothetical protein
MHIRRMPTGRTKGGPSWTRAPCPWCPTRMAPPASELFLSPLVQILIPYRSECTSAMLDYGGGPEDAPVPTRGHFTRRAPIEIPACWLKRSPSEGRSFGGEEGREGVIPLFLIFTLLIAISQGFRLGGSFLPPYPCGHPDDTLKPPSLPLCPLPLVLSTVGVLPRHILKQGNPPWGTMRIPKTLHKNVYVLKKQKLAQINKTELEQSHPRLTTGQGPGS